MKSSHSGSERSPFAVYLDDPKKIALMHEKYKEFVRSGSGGVFSRFLNNFPIDDDYIGNSAALTDQLPHIKDVIKSALIGAGSTLNNDKTAERLAREAGYASEFIHWIDMLMVDAVNTLFDDAGHIKEDICVVFKKAMDNNDALLEDEQFKLHLISGYIVNISGSLPVVYRTFGGDFAITDNPYTMLYRVFSNCINQISLNLEKTRYDLFARAFNRLIQYPIADSVNQRQTKQEYIDIIRQTRVQLRPELLTFDEARAKYELLTKMCEQYVSSLELLKHKEAKKTAPKVQAHMTLESEQVQVENKKDKGDDEYKAEKTDPLLEAARTPEVQDAVNGILQAIKTLYEIKSGPGKKHVISEKALTEIQAALGNAYRVIDEIVRAHTKAKLVGADDLRDVIVEAIRGAWLGQHHALLLKNDLCEKLFEIINKNPNPFSLLPDYEKYYFLARDESDSHKKADYQALDQDEKQKHQMAMLVLMEFASDISFVRGEHFWGLCQHGEINPEDMTLNDAEQTLQCAMNDIKGKGSDFEQAQEMLGRVWGMGQEGISERVIKYMLINEALKIAHKGDESVLLPLPVEEDMVPVNETSDNERSALLIESVEKLDRACVDYKRHLLNVLEPILAREYPLLHQRYVSISQQSGKKLFNQDLFTSDDFKTSNIRQHPVLAAVMEKYDAVHALQQTLKTDELPMTRLRSFSEVLDSKRGILEKHRGNDANLVKFFKFVGRVLATVFTAGAAYSRLWKSTGERAAEGMQQLLPEDVKSQSAPKKRK